MPAGVEVLVEDGLATVVFVDQLKRGVGLGALLNAGGPESVSKVTRPRVAYIVPVDVARAAGLLDESSTPTAEPEVPPADSDGSHGYDDGEPDLDWSRDQLNAAATKAGVVDAEKLPKKAAVLDAYRKAKAAQNPAP